MRLLDKNCTRTEST